MNSYQIDEKLEPILNQMHEAGIKIDVDYLNNLSDKIGMKLLKLESEIYTLVGRELNLNSPSQLAKVLYEELKIKPGESGIKRKKTHHSTSAESLAKIETQHPSIKKILEYRELAKLKNTYLDPLPKLVDKNSRLHTTYMVDTSTGRLSSKNPNLQNIPIRTEIGKEMRKAFVAEKGYKLLAADYSQIELRIAAHFSQDETMLKAFKEGKDIHHATAEELGIDRRTAKTVNFGILYGISSYGLAESLKIPQEDAQTLIDKYFVSFPKLAKYIQQTIAKAEDTGYVETLYGRKRMIPELHSPIERIRKFGERIAINTPFQGTAAEIIKLAMIEVANRLSHIANRKEKNDKPYAISHMPAALLLQIHDELVLEVPEEDVKDVTEIVRETMQNAVKLSVPIIVDLEVGKNWGEMEKI